MMYGPDPTPFSDWWKTRHRPRQHPRIADDQYRLSGKSVVQGLLGMLPGVGEAMDAWDVGAGLLQKDPKRVGAGLLGAALPFVTGRTLYTGFASSHADDVPLRPDTWFAESPDVANAYATGLGARIAPRSFSGTMLDLTDDSEDTAAALRDIYDAHVRGRRSLPIHEDIPFSKKPSLDEVDDIENVLFEARYLTGENYDNLDDAWEAIERESFVRMAMDGYLHNVDFGARVAESEFVDAIRKQGYDAFRVMDDYQYPSTVVFEPEKTTRGLFGSRR